MTVNIIVIGGFNSRDQLLINPDDIETWNNPEQANYNVLLALYQNLIDQEYDITILAFDGMYPATCNTSIIPHYKENFYLSSVEYYRKNSINIVVAFCPVGLDETWVSTMNQPPVNLQDVKDYSFALIMCGCLWNKGFPVDTIMGVINYKLTTPIDYSSIDSYLDMISTVSIIKKNNIFADMVPFIKGTFTILGTLMFRGCATTDYGTEHVIRELVSILDLDKYFEDKEIKNDLENFMTSKLKHWNQMKRQTRLALCNLVYGMETDYMA